MSRYSLAIVANRLPVHRVGRGKRARWEISPGGLVSALTPILRRAPSAWIGWAGLPGKAPAPFDEHGIHNAPVALSKSELETFYEGFSNRTLWPLYHDAIRTPEYHRDWWRPYVTVNTRFAEAAAEVVADDGIVWVHDYHFQLVPALLRERRPDLRIGFFLHIPFPPLELFAQLPWRRPLLEGLLGADVVGFQTQVGADNFCALAEQYTDAFRCQEGMRVGDRVVHVGAFPISIDVARVEAAAKNPDVVARARDLHHELGGRRVVLGVDRLDYTKGIDQRLHAFGELLSSGRIDAEEIVLVQTAVPSRQRVDEYVSLRSRVEELVGSINGAHGRVGQVPVHYLRQNLDFDELVALYVAADVMLVTPYRDGMNLVAKEYVCARLDETGVLVLSEFTGSAVELSQALLVNPHDLDGMADAIDRALAMPAAEQQQRMAQMRSTVAARDVYRWADEFLETLQG